jgi:hypothetical protein
MRMLTHTARERTNHAHMCAFAYLLMYSLHIWWEYNIDQHDVHVLLTLHVQAPCAREW